jgi:hypothetical protein
LLLIIINMLYMIDILMVRLMVELNQLTLRT